MDSWVSLFENWQIMITMIFGSFIAGASSEGGGAIAFPVMTLLLDISPAVARNFSLAIQSIGMTAATLLILDRRIEIEKKSILWASLGGIPGIIFSTFYMTSLFQPATLKVFFVSLWLAFGYALYSINRDKDRLVYHSILNLRIGERWVLFGFGLVGGMITGLIGNGIDILTFCLLTLFFGVSEKVATPTSVVLMTINTIVGFLLHAFVVGDFFTDPVASSYWHSCIPIVIFGAPMGAWAINRLRRTTISIILYCIIFAQFVIAILVLSIAGTLSLNLIVFSAATIIFGILVFGKLYSSGMLRNRLE